MLNIIRAMQRDLADREKAREGKGVRVRCPTKETGQKRRGKRSYTTRWKLAQ
jgi:hypothetical protein